MPYKDPHDPRRLAYKKAYNKKYRGANREYFREAFKDWYRKNPDKPRIYRDRYLESGANRVKHTARAKVYYALKTGKLIRPDRCTRCSVVCKPEAHHPDHDKPLEVIWLCRPCHYAVE